LSYLFEAELGTCKLTTSARQASEGQVTWMHDIIIVLQRNNTILVIFQKHIHS